MDTTTAPQQAGSSQPTPVTPTLIQSFNNYPWVKDRQFLQGLTAMLGPLLPSTDMARAASTSLQARIWWFGTKQGITISPDTYAAYLAAHPDTATPEPAILARVEDVQRRMGIAPPPESPAAGVPSWQVHAPKADLAVKAADGTARGSDGPAAAAAADGDAPYPEHFKAVIEAVTQGKPVPGIKEIPNTLVRLPGISPVGKMQAPRKPWEKAANGTTPEVVGQDTEGSSSLPQNYLDAEFPPVEEETKDHQGQADVAVET